MFLLQRIKKTAAWTLLVEKLGLRPTSATKPVLSSAYQRIVVLEAELKSAQGLTASAYEQLKAERANGDELREWMAGIREALGVGPGDTAAAKIAELLRDREKLVAITAVVCGDDPPARDPDAEFRRNLGLRMGTSLSSPEKLLDHAERYGRLRRRMCDAARALAAGDIKTALDAIRGEG